MDSETPDPTAARPRGGPAYHKDGCRCNPCKARRRTSEAIALASGEGGGVDPDQTSGVLVKVSETEHDSPITRRHVAAWLKAKAEEPDLTNIDIAKRLGIAPKTLTNQIYKARKAGWLTFDDPLEEVEYGIVPKVVKNLNKFLDDEDKQVTIEVAKGTLFKQFQESKGITEKPMTILAIKLELPELGESQIVSGKIVGKPKTFVDAQIVETPEQKADTEP